MNGVVSSRQGLAVKLSARQTDVAGNASASQGLATVTLDTVLPAITVTRTGALADNYLNAAEVSGSGTTAGGKAEANATVYAKWGTLAEVATTANASGD